MDHVEHLPLSETSFFILLSLASSPKHGYAILKEVERLSDERVSLATGTLYSALKRMLDERWIERAQPEQVTVDGRTRKYYQLTQLGQRILAAETERLKKLVETARELEAGAD